MNIPDKMEWEGCDNMDCQSAYVRFFGKKNNELNMTFRESPISAFTDLRFMPARPFQYYFIGYKDFVLGAISDSSISAEAAYCFLLLTDIKLRENPEDIVPIWNNIFTAIEFVASNQNQYLAPKNIYGDFFQMFNAIKDNAKEVGLKINS